MSHEATGWASRQRGIKPAAKVVLWQLCDRFHPDNGCFPSQDTLADDCEMSRSSLNDQLCALESAGLIRREQRRDGKTRKQKSTRYRFAFEPGFAAENDEKPCPNSGHGSVSEKGQKPCPNLGDSRVRISDTNLVREPVREPEREGAQARDSESGNQDGKPESSSTDDPSLFEKRVKRLGDGWPGWAGSSTRHTIAEFGKLSDGERAEAENHRDRYLAECRRQKVRPVALANYFRDRKWTDLPAAADEQPASVVAVVFGPRWSALRFEKLFEGPLPCAFKPTAFERAMIADGKLDEATLRHELQVRSGFPMVNAMHHHAESGRGVTLPAGHADLSDTMEAVPVGSAVWEAWRAEHERRGWPWLPDPGRQPVVYFPAGGPAGLDAFKTALAAADRADQPKRGSDDDGREGAVDRRTDRYAESRSRV